MDLRINSQQQSRKPNAWFGSKRRLADGSAQILLRDIVAALGALGLHFQTGPDGLDREGIKAQRSEWESARRASEYAQPPR